MFSKVNTNTRAYERLALRLITVDYCVAANAAIFVPVALTILQPDGKHLQV